nr:unnamed protein product [Callosobruchus analis]
MKRLSTRTVCRQVQKFSCLKSRLTSLTSDIFLLWLKNHFIPRKPEGTVVLILDGHSSHCTSVDMLELAEEYNIVLLCLPSHTTHYLQLLDRAFFKALKSYYYNACNSYIKMNPNRKISRLVFGRLLTKAWVQAATTENAISGFRSTGIVPFNPDVILEYAFLMSAPDQQQDHNEQHENRPASPKPGCSHWQEISNPSEQATAEVDSDLALEHRHVSPELGYPQWAKNPQESMHTSSEATTVATKKSQMSPGQLLKHISPIPTLDKVASARKNSRALAEVLNSSVNIVNLRNKKRQIRSTASVKSGANAKRKIKAETITNVTTKGNTKKKQPKKRKASITDTESDSSLEIHLQDDDDDVDDVECCCVGCGELYNCTKKDVDWIKCINCQLWLHEDCSKYESMCDVCGKKQDK